MFGTLYNFTSTKSEHAYAVTAHKKTPNLFVPVQDLSIPFYNKTKNLPSRFSPEQQGNYMKERRREGECRQD